MKEIILLSFIFFTSISLSQEFKIPEMKFQGELDSPNNYIELLNLEDEKSLIIKISTSSYWLNGIVSEFIVYQNDGKVLKYNANATNKIKRKALKKKNYFVYWDLLNKSVSEKRFDIQKNQLNITRKPSGNGHITEIIVYDGGTMSFEIWKENKYITFSSENPTKFIEEKFPGFEERQKLVDLIKEYNDTFENY